MPDDDAEEQDEPRIAIAPLRRDEPQVVDAYQPLPGAMRQVNEAPAAVAHQIQSRKYQAARYAQLLVRHGGDAIRALAELRGVSVADAAAHFLEYRDEVLRDSTDMDLQSLLELHDAALPQQIAVLRTWMFDEKAAPSLKAVELLRDIEGKAGARRMGQRAEDLIRMALASQEAEDEPNP
jgi:hypothetical protein